jgi:predicted histidine transporter YuiF (NhaC family)
MKKQVENVTILALNPYTNFTFFIELDFTKSDDEALKEEILWILIVIIGAAMILGLIIVFAKQSREHRTEVEQNKIEEVLIVHDEFKNSYQDINRSSADPDSVRDSIE